MKIILSDSTGKKFTTLAEWEAANVAAKAIFKKQYWSDLYYEIFFNDGTEVTGSIDLEPKSFHDPHINKIFTNHLQTFWGNISKLQQPKYGLTSADIDFCKTLLTYIPNTI